MNKRDGSFCSNLKLRAEATDVITLEAKRLRVIIGDSNYGLGQTVEAYRAYGYEKVGTRDTGTTSLF